PSPWILAAGWLALFLFGPVHFFSRDAEAQVAECDRTATRALGEILTLIEEGDLEIGLVVPEGDNFHLRNDENSGVLDFGRVVRIARGKDAPLLEVPYRAT